MLHTERQNTSEYYFLMGHIHPLKLSVPVPVKVKLGVRVLPHRLNHDVWTACLLG